MRPALHRAKWLPVKATKEVVDTARATWPEHQNWLDWFRVRVEGSGLEWVTPTPKFRMDEMWVFRWYFTSHFMQASVMGKWVTYAELGKNYHLETLVSSTSELTVEDVLPLYRVLSVLGPVMSS